MYPLFIELKLRVSFALYSSGDVVARLISFTTHPHPLSISVLDEVLPLTL